MERSEEVRKLAALARLSLSDAQVEAFAKEFEAILDYVGQLEKLDLPSVAEQAPEHRNVMRADANPHESGLYTKKIVEQFPSRDEDYLSVKQIIQHD